MQEDSCVRHTEAHIMISTQAHVRLLAICSLYHYFACIPTSLCLSGQDESVCDKHCNRYDLLDCVVLPTTIIFC